MELKAVFVDGSYIVGIRKFWYPFNESKGTHHLQVIDTSENLAHIIGFKVAIPINKPKYWVVRKKS